MKHDDFKIGVEFWCGDKRWRCTDVGSRVVVAISLEPHEVVRSERDPNDPTKRIETHYTTDDPWWLIGPPYKVAECVFDEYSIAGCSLEREEPYFLRPPLK
jgi:hypothetical protein